MTTRPSRGTASRTVAAAASSWPLPGAAAWASTAPASCAYAATRWTPGTASPWIPRNVLPSSASADTGRTSVRSSHPPTAASNAATSSTLNTRCSVATLGLRPGGSPSGTRAAGSSSTRSRAHCAIAYRLRAPHSIAATATCSMPTRGSGDLPGDHPYGRRGSGTAANASAKDPGAADGPAGTTFRLSPITHQPSMVPKPTPTSVKLKCP